LHQRCSVPVAAALRYFCPFVFLLGWGAALVTRMVNSSSAAAVVVDMSLFPYAMWMNFATDDGRWTMMNDGTGMMMVAGINQQAPLRDVTPNSLMMTEERNVHGTDCEDSPGVILKLIIEDWGIVDTIS
jgi:hypothetical protein